MSATSTRPVRRRGTPKLPREKREQQLLDAATLEFGTVGYGSASLTAIGDRVGVSKALVHTYHGSKDDLYAACVERAGANLAERIEEVITRPQSPAEMAVNTLAAIFDALAPRPHDWNLLHDRSLPATSRAAEVMHTQRQAIAEQASRGVRGFAHLRAYLDDDDLELLTEGWMSVVTAAVGWWLHNPERTPQEMAARCHRIILALAEPSDD